MAIAFLNNITFSGGSQAEKLRLENLAADPATKWWAIVLQHR
jgi:hypothetical protein